MDSPSLSTPGASSSNAHLSFPSQTRRSPTPPTPPPKAPRELHKSRLFVGNLHPTVDEYTFLQVFSKYGAIARLDFLFHKTGPNKGKPRGFAFVEYSDKEDANKALVNAHDKLLRGRKLIVTFAHQAPHTDMGGGYVVGSKPGFRKTPSESSKPTALSLMKTTPQQGKTEDKIAALEAKLNQMQQLQSSTAPPLHHSLPHKPPPTRAPVPGSSASSAKPSLSLLKDINYKSRIGAPGPGKKPTLQELMRGAPSTGISGLMKKT